MNPVAPVLEYRLGIREPARHLVDVELHIGSLGGEIDHVDLSMAAWCPGSYLIRDYARYVRDLEVTDGRGARCAANKVSKHSWRVAAAGAEALVVRYRVYGNELSARTNHIDATHAFIHGPATFLFAEQFRDHPCRLFVSGPASADWPVVTGLCRDGDGFCAVDIDELLDCPLHLGPAVVREFEAAARPTRLVVWGRPDSERVATVDQLVADLAAIIDQHVLCWKSVPYERYTFILMLASGAYGGLEHGNSSANLMTPLAFSVRAKYEELLELLSHEFFHVWNGKRLYPGPLHRVDYERETYTRSLWVVEGITSYYDRYMLRRAQRLSVKRYLEKLAEEWGKLQMVPGRAVQSLQEASFDAWIKLYRPDESNVNSTVSYYLKGGLVALALDLEIRHRCGGARTLDDVIRHLWRSAGPPQAGYADADVQALFEEACGMPLGDFFARFVHGVQDPELPGALRRIGLELRGGWEPGPSGAANNPASLGIALRTKNTVVEGVLDGSAAASAGISAGDELVALGGYRVEGESDLRERLGSRVPGEMVAVALFRRDQLLELAAVLEPSPPTRYQIIGCQEASAEEKQRFAEWLGEPHPGPGELAAASVGRWL